MALAAVPSINLGRSSVDAIGQLAQMYLTLFAILCRADTRQRQVNSFRVRYVNSVSEAVGYQAAYTTLVSFCVEMSAPEPQPFLPRKSGCDDTNLSIPNSSTRHAPRPSANEAFLQLHVPEATKSPVAFSAYICGAETSFTTGTSVSKRQRQPIGQLCLVDLATLSLRRHLNHSGTVLRHASQWTVLVL